MASQLFRTDSELIGGLQLKDFSPNDGFAVVVWNPSRYTGSKYVIRWWSDGEDDMCEKVIAVPVCKIFKLKPGCRYWIQVAIDQQVHSKVYCKPLYFLTAPPVVENVKFARSSKSSYNIYWDPVPGARKYIIRYCRIDEAFKICETKTTDFNLCGLDQGYAYVCSVAAENDAGTGAFSTSGKFSTDLPGPDFVKHEVTCSKDEAIAEIYFPPTKCENVENYKVFLMNDDGEVIEKNTQKPSVTFKKLQLGVCYTPMVIAETSYQIQSNKTYGDFFWTKPQKVSGVRTELATKTVEKVKWNSAQGALSYVVVYGDIKRGMKQEETEDCEILLTDLSPETNYFVNIFAKGRGGQGIPSDKVFFQTVLPPPQNVHLSEIVDGENYGFLAEWQPTEGAVAYNVDIVDVKRNETWSTKERVENFFECMGLLPGIEYKVKVQAVASKELRNSTIVTSASKWTGPPIITDFRMCNDSLTSRLFTWAKIPNASYSVRIKKAGHPSQSKDVTTNEFHLGDLDYHSKYTVSVTAKINEIEGKESKRIELETALFHPTSVRAESDSTTSVAVQFDEPKIPANRYQIRTITVHGKTLKTQIVTRQQALMRILIDNLQPGCIYQIAVCSLHDENPTLNSKEVISKIVHTHMPALQPKLEKISGNSVGIKWNSLTGAVSYKVYWRREHQKWEEREENGNEASLCDLQYGSKYEVKVVAIGSMGKGEESIIIPFSTVPAPPQGLKAEYLSPSEVKIWCDKVQGAESYIFTVCNKTYEDSRPITFAKIEAEILKISVSAKNSDNESSAQSETIEFEQTLLHLRRKFRKIAKNQFTYIPPDFQDLVTGNLASDFGTDKFKVKKGETYLVIGQSSTGKTSACYHYLQDIPDDKLAIYLDYDEFKEMTQKTEVEGILGKCMTDVKPEHIISVLAWMKSNCDKVVFVIDNFELPVDFKGGILHYADKRVKEQIFYNLITTRREIFPDSQVFCTSHQDDLQSLINISSVWKIIGFGNAQIQKMVSHILKDENANVLLTTQLKYFCINPCYCNTILQFLKKKHDVDVESYSSILIKILSESLERHPVAKKKEKLTKLANEVVEFENSIHYRKVKFEKPSSSDRGMPPLDTISVSSVMSDVPSFVDIEFQRNFEGNSCESLHRSIVSALYFGYFCLQRNLKPLLKKERINFGDWVNMWIMATGLMRPDISDLAEELFKPINKKPIEVSKKLKALKEFIKDNAQNILCQVYRKHQIVLNWFSVISETSDEEIIRVSKLKIKIDNSMAEEEITEVTEFLKKVPASFCPYVELVYSKDLKPDREDDISMAIRENPNKELLKLPENQSTGSSTKFGLRRRSTKKSFESASQLKAVFEDTHHHNAAQYSFNETTSKLENALNDVTSSNVKVAEDTLGSETIPNETGQTGLASD